MEERKITRDRDAQVLEKACSGVTLFKACCSKLDLWLLNELLSAHFGAETRTVFEFRAQTIPPRKRGYQRACWEWERLREIPIGEEP